jgi:hypothetical protein
MPGTFNVRAGMRNARKSKPSALAFREVLKAELAKRSPKFDSWFDLWHRHVDWEGGGRLSRQHRNFELWALFKTLHRFERETHHLRERCQVFAYLYEQDSGSDAVYVHTPNPNGTPFPYEPEVSSWLTATPSWLAGRISLERYNLGVTEGDGERCYFVQRKT